VRILRKCFKAGTNNVLRHPLGRWYKGRIQQEWPQVFSPETQRVYVYKAQTVRYYERRLPRQKRFRYVHRTPTAAIPKDAVPISGHFEQGYFIADSAIIAQTTQPPMLTDPETTRIESMLRGTRFHVPTQVLANALWNGDAIIGTDGSVLDEQGSYAFIILINLHQVEPTLAVRSGGWMSPTAEFIDLDSHRPEAAALYAAQMFLQCFLRKFPFCGSICDNVLLCSSLTTKV